jgi:hypothetical protein
MVEPITGSLFAASRIAVSLAFPPGRELYRQHILRGWALGRLFVVRMAVVLSPKTASDQTVVGMAERLPA